jgi:Raf kinase inhibitor-like YbhB/YbcL family protein
MKIGVMIAALAGAALFVGVARAQIPAAKPLPTVPTLAPAGSHKLKVHVDAVKSGHLISSDYQFCMAAAQGHFTAAPDKSPSIEWSKGPAGTKSYAIIMYDTDSPLEHREWMNQEGQTLTAAIQRKIFYHWLLVDIPTNVTSLAEAADSDARVAHGKQAPAKIGVHGRNDYTLTFAANDAMKGDYYGYDGPCAPWNDTNIHHYHFTVYALSVPSLGLSGAFDGAQALAAMQGKVLAQGELLGLYSINPSVITTLPK